MSSVAPPAIDEQRKKLAAIQPVPVKAHLDFRHGIGRAIQRAISVAGWSYKEAAGHIWPNRDVETGQAQLSRWMSGAERPHLDVLFGVEALQWPLIESLAMMAHGACEVRTDIRRRVA